MLVHFPENLVKILHYGRSYVLSIDIWKVIMEDFTFTTENSSLAEYLLKKKVSKKLLAECFLKKSIGRKITFGKGRGHMSCRSPWLTGRRRCASFARCPRFGIWQSPPLVSVKALDKHLKSSFFFNFAISTP
jgi:hypothetical protein